MNKKSNNQRIDEPNVSCPFCKSTEKKLNGHSPNKLQRYRCKNCGHTYSTRTGTVLHSLKKPDVFMQYAQKMQTGYYTLKKMSEEFNITISTAFHWRRKVLTMIKTESFPNEIV